MTVLKQYFPKLKPKAVSYRDYQNFQNNEFRAELDNEMSKHHLGNMEYQHFLNIFIKNLNKHAPMKQKYLRANHGRFMTKVLHEAIMKRSRLISFYVTEQIFRQKNTKSKEIFVLAY